MKKINNGVGKRIKDIRMARKLTQAAFGDKIGISEGYVGMMENGRRKPSQWLLAYIAGIFVVDANWLRTGRKE